MKSDKSKYAVFFDRDRTLNYDPGYLKNPADVKLYDGVPEGIARLKNDLGFIIIVVSNQSGISRGLLTEKDLEAVNSRVNELITLGGASIDGFYYCSFHPDFSSPKEKNCRKPEPAMILEAAEDFGIDLGNSYMVGDKPADIEAGKRAGVKTILALYGLDEKGISEAEALTPDFRAASFTEVVEIIDRMSKGVKNG